MSDEKVRTPVAMAGVEMIAAERRRQIEGEGWTASHDDGHSRGEMAVAAAMYAVLGTDATVDSPHTEPSCWIKPGDRLRELAKAGALIAAEIDRLLRNAIPGTKLQPIPGTRASSEVGRSTGGEG